MAKRKAETAAQTAYAALLEHVFRRHYRSGLREFEFDRTSLKTAAEAMKVELPSNIGDVIYTFRYRAAMPPAIARETPRGFAWIIEGAGRGRYRMRLCADTPIAPRADLLAVKIPDATPEIIARYAQNDEQALLAKLRYNRLVDIFLGLTAYSLQNHLRTTVKGLGQIEVDELYVAVDRAGVHFVVPVQAKMAGDRHNVVQTLQDIAFCKARFPQSICRAVSAQALPEDTIAMFELTAAGEQIRVVQERHYRLVANDGLSSEELAGYRARNTP